MSQAPRPSRRKAAATARHDNGVAVAGQGHKREARRRILLHPFLFFPSPSRTLSPPSLARSLSLAPRCVLSSFCKVKLLNIIMVRRGKCSFTTKAFVASLIRVDLVYRYFAKKQRLADS